MTKPENKKNPTVALAGDQETKSATTPIKKGDSFKHLNLSAIIGNDAAAIIDEYMRGQLDKFGLFKKLTHSICVFWDKASYGELTLEKLNSVFYADEKVSNLWNTFSDAQKRASGFEIFKPLSEIVIQDLAMKKRDSATERVVRVLEEITKFYSIRDDEAGELWYYSDGIVRPEGESFVKEFCRQLLGEVYTNRFATACCRKIEADSFVEPADFFLDENPDEIAVKNGILNLKTRKLSPFTPEKKFFSKINAEYIPGAKCPNIDKHLSEVLKFPEDKKVFYEIVGSCLYRDYFLEKGFMFVGAGRNGKSKTLELIKYFLSPENCSSLSLTDFENDQFSLGELHRKLANICSDLSPIALRNTGIFKSLTGRDQISANRKFLNRLSFVNHAKLLFACNQLPYSYDVSLAFWSRWCILEFPFTFLPVDEFDSLPEAERQNVKIADKDIIPKLTTPEELSGLLNAGLDGLARLFKQGDVSQTKSTEEIKKFWIRQSDSFQAFLLDCCSFDDYDVVMTKKELAAAYEAYCKFHKVRAASSKHIRNLLNSWGIFDDRVTINGKVERVWYGIKLVRLDRFDTIFQLLGENKNTLESEKGNKPDKAGKRSLKSDVLAFLGDSEKPIPDLIIHLETLGYCFDEQDILRKLKNSGDVFEPRRGILKAVVPDA